MKIYTQAHIQAQKSHNVGNIGSHNVLQAGPEVGAGLANEVPVHVSHGIHNCCFESRCCLGFVMPAVHLPLLDHLHKIIRRIVVWQYMHIQIYTCIHMYLQTQSSLQEIWIQISIYKSIYMYKPMHIHQQQVFSTKCQNS